jgi:hypothetical protein
MKALRQRVERVVRPVRASGRTKDRMRAELLEHLELLYEQELGRTGDTAVALENASRQFGESQALTRELQASVPRLEQWALLPLPGSSWGRRRRGEEVGAWILRTTTAGSLVSGVGITLVVVILAGLEHRSNRLGPVVPFLLAIPVLMWISLVSNFWFCELIRREIEREVSHGKRFARYSRIAGLATLSMIASALVPAVLVLMVRLTTPYPLFSNWQAVTGCVGWGLLMAIILAIQVRDWIVVVRRYEGWESLDLEGDQAS